MLATHATSEDGTPNTRPHTWGWFHGVPLVITTRVLLKVQLGSEQSSVQDSRFPSLCVYTHLVPDESMLHELLTGRDGLE